MIDKVHHLGEIDAYRGNEFLYCSDLYLCIRSLQVYRDDILSTLLAIRVTQEGINGTRHTGWTIEIDQHHSLNPGCGLIQTIGSQTELLQFFDAVCYAIGRTSSL